LDGADKVGGDGRRRALLHAEAATRPNVAHYVGWQSDVLAEWGCCPETRYQLQDLLRKFGTHLPPTWRVCRTHQTSIETSRKPHLDSEVGQVTLGIAIKVK